MSTKLRLINGHNTKAKIYDWKDIKLCVKRSNKPDNFIYERKKIAELFIGSSNIFLTFLATISQLIS